jgi:hypothetical protein
VEGNSRVLMKVTLWKEMVGYGDKCTLLSETVQFGWNRYSVEG